MKFILVAALATVSQAIKLKDVNQVYTPGYGPQCKMPEIMPSGSLPNTFGDEGYPSQTGNYSPRMDEYSDFHPTVQTYTWDSTGGHPSLNRMRAGYDGSSQYTINDNGQGKGDGQTHW